MTKTAVIFGGTGPVGREVTRAFATAGFDVIVPSRSEHNLQELAALTSGTLGNLVPLVADVTTPAGAQQVKAALSTMAPLQAVVIALGGWWTGSPLRSLDAATWDSIIASHLTGHFYALQAAYPHLDPDGAAVVALNGIATTEPIVHSGPVSVAGAGQSMMLRVFDAEEHENSTVRIHELCVMANITATGSEENSIRADIVAARVLALSQPGGTAAFRVTMP